jgi:hypothetical protein
VPDLPSPPASSVRPRIRVFRGEEIALGPGKVNLLEAIERTGTLAEAARSLGISYMRAWHLLQTMNACFREPLVQSRALKLMLDYLRVDVAARPREENKLLARLQVAF